MRSVPQYSQDEIERRWLVQEPVAIPEVTRRREIEDRYILNTHLRLRVVREVGCEAVFKLGKKYEPDATGVQRVVSTYLTEAEHQVLASLPASAARKERLTVAGGSLDRYKSPNPGLQVFEVEFTSLAAAAAYRPPPFVGPEITGNAAYTGFVLANSERPGG
jgi:CYTH domain-containing protein